LFHLLQECPEGVVHEDSFKDIYAKFFPHGSEYMNTLRNAFIFNHVTPTGLSSGALCPFILERTNSVAPEPEGSSPHSQQHANNPYPEPDESTPHPPPSQSP
jgi:hypothetical protein